MTRTHTHTQTLCRPSGNPGWALLDTQAHSHTLMMAELLTAGPLAILAGPCRTFTHTHTFDG